MVGATHDDVITTRRTVPEAWAASNISNVPLRAGLNISLSLSSYPAHSHQLFSPSAAVLSLGLTVEKRARNVNDTLHPFNRLPIRPRDTHVLHDGQLDPVRELGVQRFP